MCVLPNQGRFLSRNGAIPPFFAGNDHLLLKLDSFESVWTQTLQSYFFAYMVLHLGRSNLIQ